MSATTRLSTCLAVLVLLSACSGVPDQTGPGAAGPAQQVGYVVVQPASVPVAAELAGRTAAFATSQVRPQVSGVIQKLRFTEGSLVQAGQTLYQIDPSTYQAALDEARANLASAQATADAAREKAERYAPLADMEAVSRQDYTDAAGTARQAAAQVQQFQAQLETAKINLRFTSVPAPITGRIGRSLFTVGALVTANQADPLAVIQQPDPMYVELQQSSADLLRLRRSLQSGGVTPASAAVRLRLEDGSEYGPTGTVEFSEVTVSETTGTVTLRARFPNPDGLLLPGMFVRALFDQGVNQNAFLVPQSAVTRDQRGNASVLVVGANDRAEQRKVIAERTSGTSWVVTQGLEPGAKVIVQGTDIKPNSPVRAVPADSAQDVAATRSRAAGGSATRSR